MGNTLCVGRCHPIDRPKEFQSLAHRWNSAVHEHPRNICVRYLQQILISPSNYQFKVKGLTYEKVDALAKQIGSGILRSLKYQFSPIKAVVVMSQPRWQLAVLEICCALFGFSLVDLSSYEDHQAALDAYCCQFMVVGRSFINLSNKITLKKPMKLVLLDKIAIPVQQTFSQLFQFLDLNDLMYLGKDRPIIPTENRATVHSLYLQHTHPVAQNQRDWESALAHISILQLSQRDSLVINNQISHPLQRLVMWSIFSSGGEVKFLSGKLFHSKNKLLDLTGIIVGGLPTISDLVEAQLGNNQLYFKLFLCNYPYISNLIVKKLNSFCEQIMLISSYVELCGLGVMVQPRGSRLCWRTNLGSAASTLVKRQGHNQVQYEFQASFMECNHDMLAVKSFIPSQVFVQDQLQVILEFNRSNQEKTARMHPHVIEAFLLSHSRIAVYIRQNLLLFQDQLILFCKEKGCLLKAVKRVDYETVRQFSRGGSRNREQLGRLCNQLQ